MSSRNENEVFKEWRSSRGVQKELLELELYKLLSRHACGVCWKILGEYRSDIVNLAIFKALKNAHKFKGKSKFSTWFQQIVQNICKSDIKGQLSRRRFEVSLNDSEFRDKTNLLAVDNKILLERLLGKLTQRQRIYVQLKLQNASDAEMAEELGIPEPHVRVMWSRIRKKLRKLLDLGEEIYGNKVN